MSDVFNRTTDAFGGSFAADQAKITFPAIINQGGADAGLLVQNMNANYTQQVTRLFEVGSPNVYYVGGRTAGQSNIARVVGPRKIAREFYLTYGDICRARTNTLHFSMTAGCDGEDANVARASYTAHFVVITTIGLAVRSEDMLINEQMAMMFSSFLYE